MENKQKHLEFIQGAISRMSSNLFLLKGWTVTLVAALVALSAKERGSYYLAYFPVLAFWVLDAYFLSQERRFRALYDDVRVRPEAQVDFSMNTRPLASFKTSWPACFFSWTLLIYYGVVVVTLALTIKLIKN
jgi:hypothetical protein